MGIEFDIGDKLMAGIGIRHDDVGAVLTQTEYEEDASHEIYQDVDFNTYGYIGFQPVVENHTAADTLTIAESGSIHTNIGATEDIKLTLPQDATNGVTFRFICVADYELQIDPGAAGGIFLGGEIQTDDLHISLFIGSNLELICDSNHDWYTVNFDGAWGVVE